GEDRGDEIAAQVQLSPAALAGRLHGRPIDPAEKVHYLFQPGCGGRIGEREGGRPPDFQYFVIDLRDVLIILAIVEPEEDRSEGLLHPRHLPTHRITALVI